MVSRVLRRPPHSRASVASGSHALLDRTHDHEKHGRQRGRGSVDWVVPACPCRRHEGGDHHPSSYRDRRRRDVASDRQRPSNGTTIVFLFDPAPRLQCPRSERGLSLRAPPHLHGVVDRQPSLLPFTPYACCWGCVSSSRARHERPGRHRREDARGEVSGVCGVPKTHKAIRSFRLLIPCGSLPTGRAEFCTTGRDT